MSLDKSRAFLKFGSEAYRDARFEEASSAFRQAAEFAKAVKAERLQAQAMARLLMAMGYMGKADELRQEIFSVLGAAMKQWKDVPAVLIMQSCALRFMEPQQWEKLVKGWIGDARNFPSDVDIARASGQVAWVCNAMGNRTLAAGILEAALPVMETQLAAKDSEVAMMMYNLADLRGSLTGYRDFEKHEPLLRRAMSLQDTLLAPTHPERVAPLITAGMHCTRSGRYEEANDLLHRAVRIAVEVEGPEGGTVQMARSALAALDEALADPRAEPYLKHRVEEVDKNPASEPFDVAVRLTKLCRHYFARGKAAAAESYYRRLCEAAGKVDDMHQAILRSEMGTPGTIYALLRENRGDQAERMLVGELQLMDRVLGDEHPSTLRHVYFAGNIYRMLARHKEAARLFERYANAERKQAVSDPGRADGLGRLLDAQLELVDKKGAERTAAEIQQLTGKKPVMDPGLNEIARQLQSVWHMLQLSESPDLIGAALEGDPDAAFVVGLCYAGGQGVKADAVKARPWLENAAQAGNTAAVKTLEAMKGGAELDWFQIIASAAAAWTQKTN
jgi:TPR repeat protein